MPRYEKGDDAIETSSPVEGVQLKAAGYREVKARTDRVRKADGATAKTKDTASEDGTTQARVAQA